MSNDAGIHTERSIVNRVLNRRTVIAGASVALASLALPGQAMADEGADLDHLLELLLRGEYKPVAHGPNLGLKTVNLDDGSYSTTKIYPVVGTPGRHKNLHESVGDFYVQFAGDLCAYRLPGGSIAMRFTGSDVVNVGDGHGGVFVNGTWELKILEATGRYRSFQRGHNHMVDTLHLLAPGDGSGGAVEYCFCFISRR